MGGRDRILPQGRRWHWSCDTGARQETGGAVVGLAKRLSVLCAGWKIQTVLEVTNPGFVSVACCTETTNPATKTSGQFNLGRRATTARRFHSPDGSDSSLASLTTNTVSFPWPSV